MLRNYFLIASRNLLKSKGFSLINILGLAMGLTVCMLILAYVSCELGFDRFNDNYHTLYRVAQHQEQNGVWYKVGRTPAPLAASMKSEFPEVKNATRFALWGPMLVSHEQTSFDESGGIYAEPALFEMFTFGFVRGNAQQALASPNSIVLTESFAKKYFGEENPIGKTLTINREHPLQVTGVLYDIPARSHLRFDFVIPFEFVKNYGANLEGWGANAFYTYVQLQDPTAEAGLSEKLGGYAGEKFGASGVKFYMQPLSGIHLQSAFDFNTDFGKRGDIRYVRFFIALACVVLLLGCLNFINLSTARAIKRAKEVGLRKAVGASRIQLIAQFLGESFLLVALSGVLAVFLVRMLLPAFGDLIGKPISLPYETLQFWALFIGGLILTGLLSGSYPAFVLSSYLPVKAFRGETPRRSGGGQMRKALVVVQVSLSVLMSVSVVIIYLQLQFMSHAKLGIDTSPVLYVHMKGGLKKNYPVVREELLKYPAIESVSSTNFYSMPFKWVGSSGIRRLQIEGKSTGKELNLSYFDADYDFIETMGAEMALGRSFSRDIPGDTFNFILNEEAVRRLELTDPIGKTFDYGVKGSIIGVVKDFHFSGLSDKIEPAVIKVRPSETDYLLVRTHPGQSESALGVLRQLAQQYSEGYPIETHFLEADYEQLYEQERISEVIFGGFTLLAILISCLGLLGLATYSAETRTKEIGIRKVMGANISQLIALTSREFLVLTALSLLLALPAAGWAMHEWLQHFAYRIELYAWVFVLAGFAAMTLTFLSVGVQAARVAMINPAESLKEM
ncbi:MAG: ABC transporter permease [Bacteroidetes bacterium]|nr:MAG: ABC transporter permease [Bacteroidota bacterium]